MRSYWCLYSKIEYFLCFGVTHSTPLHRWGEIWRGGVDFIFLGATCRYTQGVKPPNRPVSVPQLKIPAYALLF